MIENQASNNPIFRRVAIIGIGLIGSSLAHLMRKQGLAKQIVCGDANPEHVRKALELKIVDEATTDNVAAIKGADLVVLSTPVSTLGKIAAEIGSHLENGCIVIDTGSVKQTVIRDVAPHIPPHAHFIPCHPIAGTEHSGPESGFAELFQNRWCLITPLPDTNKKAMEKIRLLWEQCGSKIEEMDSKHHDKVLAITSHLPHLIAFTIVGTADDLADDLKQEVIRYSASGFHDFTRVAASDPIMWRDIFLNNREAVLEIIQRFTEDLTALQRAIRRGEGETLETLFERSRVIRRGIVMAKQAEPLANVVKKEDKS